MKQKTTTWFSVYMEREDLDQPPRLIAGFRHRSDAIDHIDQQRRTYGDFDDVSYFIREEEVTTT